MESGRELFRKFLNREPLSRPAFVPMIRGLLSRVEGMPMETLTSDPTLWANSLMKTAKLFGFDGVVAGLDFSLMAEACGCGIIWKNDRPTVMPPKSGLSEAPEQSERMKHALEATRRLFEVCRPNLACVSALTGPVTLASQLFGREEGPNHIGEVKQLVVQVAEAFCKTGPDILLFLEGRPLALAEPSATHRRIYNTLKNIASYYNISVGLYLQGYRSQSISDFTKLKMDIYIMGPSLNKNLPSLSEMWNLGEETLGVGIGLPLDDLEKAKEIIHDGLRLYRDKAERGFFFTSFGPATREVNLETLHELVNQISNL
ncbi:MAG: hypothetical protein JRJ50_01175 [Deltaproteobacteria bacterium]|nr:hypothetical protein [Deltaproteobacteria bacterium]MBW2035586.1 hypothetical protein [Deltaproteobacteria bacterium]MBW2117055.1 hypothetical protein [Deltaproteobacteria bacterium]